MSYATTSLNGTIEDVASFFRVSIRTVQQWKTEKLIGYLSEGRNVAFDEEAVIEFATARKIAARRMEPGEAREISKREWRAHLRVRDEQANAGRIEFLEKRLADLEAAVIQNMVASA